MCAAGKFRRELASTVGDRHASGHSVVIVRGALSLRRCSITGPVRFAIIVSRATLLGLLRALALEADLTALLGVIEEPVLAVDWSQLDRLEELVFVRGWVLGP